MQVKVSDKLVLEIAPSREELLAEPPIVELVADAENARERLEKRVADLEYMIRRFEANTDFETRQRVAGRRIGPHDTWERWNGERWNPDTVEAGD